MVFLETLKRKQLAIMSSVLISFRTRTKQGVGIKLISLTYRLHCIMEDIWKFGKHFLLHLFIISLHFHSQYGTHVIKLWMKINFSSCLFLTEPETRFLWRTKRKTNAAWTNISGKKKFITLDRYREWLIFLQKLFMAYDVYS